MSKQTTSDNRCLSIPEMAEILQMSRHRVYYALSAGKIPAHRLGNRWIVSRRGFLEWLNAPYKVTKAKDKPLAEAIAKAADTAKAAA